jgi:hypothetical protein
MNGEFWGGFWAWFDHASQKLDGSGLFWLLLIFAIGLVLKFNLPHVFKYMNEKLEIQRRWNHNDRRLQGDIATRLSKSRSARSSDGKKTHSRSGT